MLPQLNILFTSAGRRDYLIQYFAEALAERGKIHVGNSEAICSAFTVGDAHIVTPPIFSDEYIPFLIDYCRRHEIRAIFPLFDMDMSILAQNKTCFVKEGVQVIVPSPEIAEICNDKWKTFSFLNASGIQTPQTFIIMDKAIKAIKSGKIKFPLIIKPRWGTGGIGVMIAESKADLMIIYKLVRRKIFNTYLYFESLAASDESVIIQEMVGGVEYGLDVLNNLKGQHIITAVKRKIAMRAGETDIAITEKHNELENLGAILGKLLRHPGNLDVDVFVDESNVNVIELNCRFGGGYPFTHVAGANFPAALIAWLNGQEAQFQWLSVKPNVTSFKSIVIKPG